jgi:uncharacterized FlaG/YvyC family protein
MSTEFATAALSTNTYPPKESAEIRYFPGVHRPVETPRQATPALEPATAPTRDEVEQAVAVLSDKVQMLRTSVQFSIDDESDRMVIRVYDEEKKEVILQLPPENLLKLARFFAGDKAGGGANPSAPDGHSGLLVREQA